MVDKINGVGQQQASGHSEPNRGVKLSEVQKVNAKLYEYFKAQNMKDDSYVTLSDLEQLVSYTDRNQNGKISVREAKKFGIEGSKKEIKSMLLSMDTVRDKINKSDEYTVKKNDYETDFYKNDVRTHTIIQDKDYKLTTLYEKDGKTLRETLEEKLLNGKKISTKTGYFNGNKYYSKIETDTERTTMFYNEFDEQDLKRSVKALKDDPNSVETVDYTHGEGLSGVEKHTYEGEYVKDGVTERTIEYDENGKEISHKTNFDVKEEANAQPEKTLLDVMEEEPVEEVAEPQKFAKQAGNVGGEKAAAEPQGKANPQKFRVPEGWSVSDIARKFGVSRDAVLQANISADGEKAFRTSKKGVEYFLIDQEINLPEGAKLNEDYKPKPRVRTQRQGRSGGLSEADIMQLSAKFTLEDANKAVKLTQNAKLDPQVGLGKGIKQKPVPAPAAPQPEVEPEED